MSKSLKNFITIKEILEKYNSNQLRLLFLMHKYNHTMDYSEDRLKQTNDILKNYTNFISNITTLTENNNKYLQDDFDIIDEIDNIKEKIDFYNKTYNRRDVYFMGFHPETPADPDSEAFLCDPTEEPVEHGDLEYSMMLIQKFKQLYDASCKLHKIGYYKKWPKQYYDEVVAERQNTYEKLFKKGVKS